MEANPDSTLTCAAKTTVTDRVSVKAWSCAGKTRAGVWSDLLEECVLRWLAETSGNTSCYSSLHYLSPR